MKLIPIEYDFSSKNLKNTLIPNIISKSLKEPLIRSFEKLKFFRNLDDRNCRRQVSFLFLVAELRDVRPIFQFFSSWSAIARDVNLAHAYWVCIKCPMPMLALKRVRGPR